MKNLDLTLVEPVDSTFLIRKKNLLIKALEKNKPKTEIKIAILGGSSTQDIKSFLNIFLLNKNIKPTFYESNFNTYYEEIVFDQGQLFSFNPDIIFIHTTIRNIEQLPLIPQNEDEIISLKNKLFDKFNTMWSKIHTDLDCIIIQNNIEQPLVRNFGSFDSINISGISKFVNDINLFINAHANKNAGFYINDINYLSSYYGLENWHDEKSWSLGKYAFNYSLLPNFAFNMFSIIESIYGLKKKVLVLDLDNTLWGGVIGDDGVNNIKLGPDDPISESYSRFQAYIKKIKDSGVVLAVCSKNEIENALEGLNHPQSLLGKDDFVSIKANWHHKSQNIIEIAKELNLGLDSFVFIDDNPVEREEVKNNLPEVSVPDIGKDVNQFIKIINQCNYFDRLDISNEDKKRTKMYSENSLRNNEIEKFVDYQDYLKSLKMTSRISEFDNKNFNRVHSLINKTNQFNLTTKRYTDKEVKDVMNNENIIGIYGNLKDKFGDNGIVTVLAGTFKPKSSEFIIELWCMSCRVFKRDLEFFLFNHLIQKLKAKLEKLEKSQEKMKAVNKIIRRKRLRRQTKAIR